MLQREHLARVGDQRLVVRRADDGGARGARQVGEERRDRAGGRFVEPRRRLVREQDRGGDGDRAGDRDALPLACGEPVGAVVETVVEADLGERVERPLPPLPADAANVKAELDVLVGGQVRHEPRLLGDEADVPPPHGRGFGTVEGAELAAVDDHVACRRPVEPCEQVEQRRLAAPGAPDEGGQRRAVEPSGHRVENCVRRPRVPLHDAPQLGGDGPFGPGRLFGSRSLRPAGALGARHDDAAFVDPEREAPCVAERLEGRLREPDPPGLRHDERPVVA